MLFKTFLLVGLASFSSAAVARPRAVGCGGGCPEGQACVQYGEMSGIMRCEAKRELAVGCGGGCPDGQACVQYGEMGGIMRCEAKRDLDSNDLVTRLDNPCPEGQSLHPYGGLMKCF
ncbi:uncharacterized protein J7T54_000502 [Emericellopsis cladophorae]|uniref:Uncharacterized protein n=1 Tax=Emericellopsis cladophorae TaxID=2686198 RepID=A0A9Q0BBT1_9HYPO|nr:uncharacterized protein J7T54_000502 [Emericellopsis cladophorae]KAI6778384.1 hypothetical protein J7T54_000502 [Emericellopsis cladophorae]